jgi:hypothetical protein
VSQAFSAPNFEEEFKQIKRAAVDDELEIDDKKRKIIGEGNVLN